MHEFLNPYYILFLAAELTFILVNSDDIKLACKSKTQRTDAEQTRVDQGLSRSLLLDFLVFVPVSAFMVLLLSLALIEYSGIPDSKILATYVILGIVSYGFPLASIRLLMVNVVLRTLHNFAAVVISSESDTDKKP